MKNSCVNFFYKIVNKISIKVKRNTKFKEFAKTSDDQFISNPDVKKILTFMK